MDKEVIWVVSKGTNSNMNHGNVLDKTFDEFQDAADWVDNNLQLLFEAPHPVLPEIEEDSMSITYTWGKRWVRVDARLLN